MQPTKTNETPFLFSIVSAVYRAQEYLEDFIGSLLSQTLDFRQNVQLILVDDGSPDRSGELCDRYREQYPENITVVHKENGGAASARNAGLPHVRGKYINFCDPDDMLSENTLESVLAYFEAHEDEADIAAIPIFLFGASTNSHHLNNKFLGGTRVIPLEKEYFYPQLSAASAFFPARVKEKLHFDERLMTAEDAEMISRLLLDRPFLGVVAEAKYFYRRYGTSLIATAPDKKEWYLNYMRYFAQGILNLAEKKYGYLPRFVQNTVMCDLQWKLQLPSAPAPLSEEECSEYRKMLDDCIFRMEDEVIMAQRSLSLDIKLHLLQRKAAAAAKSAEPEPFLFFMNDNIIYGNGYHDYHRFSNNRTEFSFLRLTKETVRLSLREVVLNLGVLPDRFYLSVNGEKIEAESCTRTNHVQSNGAVVSFFYHVSFAFPRSLLDAKETLITLHTVLGSTDVEQKNINPGTFFPVGKRYRNAYYAKDGLVFRFCENALCVQKADRHTIRKLEKAYCKELWQSSAEGAGKASLVRPLVRFLSHFCKKEIWLISDRLNKCGDNGEAFFRHLKNIGFRGARTYYCINRGADYQKMKKVGRVVARDSARYKILHLLATNIISSHGDDFVINPFNYYSEPYRDLLRTKNYIFLQHGVTQNDISGWLNKYNKNIRGFVCAAKPEHDSIVNTPAYFYTNREVWLTGFARFDRLYRNEKKYITIMPTWRRYLMGELDPVSGVWGASEEFCKSDYFRFYNGLINDPRLLAAARQYGYTVCYMPHPNIITKADLFDHHPDVRFFTIGDEYRDVYAESDLVLSDYSSALFDFAYLRKPVLYAQFDKAEFFKGDHVCVAGYFDYERDGFGEVTYDLDSTVDLLINYMKNGCQLKPVYRERIDRFFAFDDRNNCQRILDRILQMEEEDR